MKRLFENLRRNGIVEKAISVFGFIKIIFVGLFSHLLRKKEPGVESYIHKGFRVMDRIAEELDECDLVFASLYPEIDDVVGISSKARDHRLVDAEKHNKLLLRYTMCYRALEALRIVFIYFSNNMELKKKIFKLQDLLEIRIKFMDTESWLSISRHDALYGMDSEDVMNSPLILMFS